MTDDEETPRFSVEVDDSDTKRHGYTRFCIFDDDFGYDALIRVGGDFASKEQHYEYCKAVCDALNAAQIPTDKTTKFPYED